MILLNAEEVLCAFPFAFLHLLPLSEKMLGIRVVWTRAQQHLVVTLLSFCPHLRPLATASASSASCSSTISTPAPRVFLIVTIVG